MPVYLLNETPLFPPATEAEPDGLLAVGGDLSIDRLLAAYCSGIFPWFESEGLFYWFSPDPRLVMFPGDFKVSSSFSRLLTSNKFEIRKDTAFREVMKACSKVPRAGQDESWITGKFINGYCALHKAGFAHSFETYFQNELVGGLYGVSLGKAFFGESMFHTMPDASKFAFYKLNEFAKKNDFLIIDCQVETDHLKRLGAVAISRNNYLELLKEALKV